ncbi:hypothetical protein [Gracilibacillus kekensis]|uniref:DUF2953 domain-containing protein n=1 Tax=Gracilibacillus kekensis TaxID=1027249 RepID=A0A1M7NQC6_9BACI|nr:hypothetical protein [Gracilibacillus kekensis]SHN05574.1 hypothetical protein SAMN05216179_1657 [Gracilibacillus kekensis]
MIFLLLAFLIVFITLVFVIFQLRIYIQLIWQIDEEEKYLQVSANVLKFSFYQKEIDFTEWDLPSIDKQKGNWREKFESFKKIMRVSKVEKMKSVTMVATDDPAITAYIYTFLKVINEWITSVYSKKNASEMVIGANFEENVFQSSGECMISMKLSKTIKEIRKLK